jgi:hypothetical protein
MTQAEKAILEAIVQELHSLAKKIDSVEGALIHSGLLMNGQSGSLLPNYDQAATNDLAHIRSAIANLRVTK